jgi:hypothetical protein
LGELATVRLSHHECVCVLMMQAARFRLHGQQRLSTGARLARLGPRVRRRFLCGRRRCHRRRCHRRPCHCRRCRRRLRCRRFVPFVAVVIVLVGRRCCHPCRRSRRRCRRRRRGRSLPRCRWILLWPSLRPLWSFLKRAVDFSLAVRRPNLRTDLSRARRGACHGGGGNDATNVLFPVASGCLHGVARFLAFSRRYATWRGAGLAVQASVQFTGDFFPAAAFSDAYSAGAAYGTAFARHFGPTLGACAGPQLSLVARCVCDVWGESFFRNSSSGRWCTFSVPSMSC